jgi:hypothetical protein
VGQPWDKAGTKKWWDNGTQSLKMRKEKSFRKQSGVAAKGESRQVTINATLFTRKYLVNGAVGERYHKEIAVRAGLDIGADAEIAADE